MKPEPVQAKQRTIACGFSLLLLFFTWRALGVTNEPPRAARSVHLAYPAPDAALFYNEVIVDQSTAGSYFMVCGWNTGYFGIQELANQQKVILFSVWDPAKGDDPQAVKPEERVECLYQAPDVRIRRFGGEGTGGQCMGEFAWVPGQTNRFVVTATVSDQKTAYSGYVWHDGRWKALVTFRTRTGGSLLRGLYSFIEDFRRDTRSAGEARRAGFGNGWVKTPTGDWVPLAKARFTASSSAWEAKDSINAGKDGDWYFLATGGETHTTFSVGDVIQLEAAQRKPPNVQLPPIK